MIAFPSPRLSGDSSCIAFSHEKVESATTFYANTLVLNSPLSEVFAVNNNSKLCTYWIIVLIGR